MANTVDPKSEGDNSTLLCLPIVSYIIGISTNLIDLDNISNKSILSKRIISIRG